MLYLALTTLPLSPMQAREYVLLINSILSPTLNFAIFSSFLPDSVRRGIFAFPFRRLSMLFSSVSGLVVAIRCHSVAYHRFSAPLLLFSSRFDYLRCLSAAVCCVAFLFRFRACPCFAFPLRSCSMPIISMRFRCCAFRRLSIRFLFGAVRFFSIRFYSFANRVAAYLFRCGYLPVLPKPFSPRSPLAISSTMTTSLVSQGVTTSCDILSPRFTVYIS